MRTTKREIHIIAHDIRSRENVGMLFRNLEFLGVSKLWLTGYTPSPPDKKIEKIALGAERTLAWEGCPNVEQLIDTLRKQDFRIVALEMTNDATPVEEYDVPRKVAILLGREVDGVSPSLLRACDDVIVIPRQGQKESLNVAFAAAIAAWEFVS